MITALGIGLMGFGFILAYAGVTGQHLTAELESAFGHKVQPATGAASAVPPAQAAAAGAAAGSQRSGVPGTATGPPLLLAPQPGMTGSA